MDGPAYGENNMAPLNVTPIYERMDIFPNESAVGAGMAAAVAAVASTASGRGSVTHALALLGEVDLFSLFVHGIQRYRVCRIRSHRPVWVVSNRVGEDVVRTVDGWPAAAKRWE